MAHGRDSVCDCVKVICASSVVYACVHLSVRVYFSPSLSLSTNCVLYVCVCVHACVCVEVCSGQGQWQSEREGEVLLIFSTQPCQRKICLGGTVITSLSHPSLPRLSLPLSHPPLLFHLAYMQYLSIRPRPKQSAWCALTVVYFWMPARLGESMSQTFCVA